MNKYIITFGYGQLRKFNVRPNDVALIVEGNDMYEARQQVFDCDYIQDKFCTSYPYTEMKDFRDNGMKEYTLDELMKLKIGE